MRTGKVIGVDPGQKNVGIVVHESDKWKTKTITLVGDQQSFIEYYEGLKKIVCTGDEIAIESLPVMKYPNPKLLIHLHGQLAITHLIAYYKRCNLAVVHPSTAKKAYKIHKEMLKEPIALFHTEHEESAAMCVAAVLQEGKSIPVGKIKWTFYGERSG